MPVVRLVDATICRRFPWMVAVVGVRAMRLVFHTDAPSPPRPGWSAVVRLYRYRSGVGWQRIGAGHAKLAQS